MQTVRPGLRSKNRHSTHNARISPALRTSSATRKLSTNGVVGSNERRSGRIVGNPEVIWVIVANFSASFPKSEILEPADSTTSVGF